jgi:hypothetical protein
VFTTFIIPKVIDLLGALTVSSQYLGESQDIGLPNWGGRIIWGNSPQLIERIPLTIYGMVQE